MDSIGNDSLAELSPLRMTVKWLSKRTDEELQLLAKRWEGVCRGNMIRREIEKREKMKENK